MLERPQATHVRWLDCPDKVSWADKAADRIAAQLTDGITQRGTASLIVPGGSTPAPIFERLSAMHLDWAKVHVGLTDERWVKATHTDSNEHLVRRALLRGQAKGAVFHPLYNAAKRPSAGLAEAERQVGAMPRPFDAVLLGMGTDGHFASLFPGVPETTSGIELQNAALCIAIDKPQSGYARMSLTLAALLYSRLILVAISGRPKRAIALQAMAGQGDYPIAALLAARKDDIEILWTE